MPRLTLFQVVVLGIFAGFTLVGVGVFATRGGLGGSNDVGKVVVWGTLSNNSMQTILAKLGAKDKTLSDVSYVSKDSRTYVATLVNAMASGKGPDLFLLSQDQLELFTDKVLLIPFGAVSQGSFLSSYVDEAQLFLTSQGELALPFTIDPLVMYWNKDMFASAGLPNPPRYWNDLLEIAPKITSLDKGVDLRKSAVALGTWSNIRNAKAILSALFMQAGDGIVQRANDDTPLVLLGSQANGSATAPAGSALRFYTEFANPSKTSYSWNRSLSEAQSAFASGDVAVYFGFASEYSTITALNPNLHFGVAVLPQIEGNTLSGTFAKMTGFAVPRSSSNPRGAMLVAIKLSSLAAAPFVAEQTNLPPVRRDIAVESSDNAAVGVFVQSALIANAWLDIDPDKTNSLFQGMIESVASGQSDPSEAVSDAAKEMESILGK